MAARHSQRPMVGMALAGLAMLAGCASAPGSDADSAKLRRIQNIVVFYAENHSFDNLYGLFPGANGIGRATPEQMTQLDHDGKPLAELLTFGRDGKRGPIDSTGDDTTSILQLITQRFGLEPLPGVRANAGNLAAALQ